MSVRFLRPTSMRCMSTKVKPQMQPSAPNLKEFKIYRWDPTSKGKPYMSTYMINLNE